MSPLCPGQTGSHEEGAKDEGVAAAGRHKETFPPAADGPAGLTDTKTGPGDQQEGDQNRTGIFVLFVKILCFLCMR